MKGEIGTLLRDGQQVGGILDWQISVKDIPDEGASPAIAGGTAQAYWLFDSLSSGQYQAKLYSLLEGELRLVQDIKIDARFPMCVPDKLIRHEFKFQLC